MSVTLRGRTVSFDNLASGSASGTERTILTSLPPVEHVGGLDNPKSGSTWGTAPPDNHVSGTACPAGENRK